MNVWEWALLAGLVGFYIGAGYGYWLIRGLSKPSKPVTRIRFYTDVYDFEETLRREAGKPW